MTKDPHNQTRKFAGRGKVTKIQDAGFTARQRLVKNVKALKIYLARKVMTLSKKLLHTLKL